LAEYVALPVGIVILSAILHQVFLSAAACALGRVELLGQAFLVSECKPDGICLTIKTVVSVMRFCDA
jgi:hypothetical protein